MSLINQLLLKQHTLHTIIAVIKQTTANKLGEIKFRSQIVNQQTQNIKLFENEPTLPQFKKIIKPKLKETEKKFRALQKNGVKLSPYLEIGSEHCLRPMILENNFKVHGIASDISIYSLKSTKKYAHIFKFKKLPRRICIDANNLPFKSNSFPFVFIYESLHHFPDPRPVLEEIYRVLAPGGCLLIGADPIKQQFQIPLWRRPNKLRFWETALKKILILPFISQIGKTETEYGIIETAFTVKTWQKSLSIFQKVQTEVEIYPFGIVEKNENFNPSPLTKLGLFFLGGGIHAVCFKEGNLENLQSIGLICPNCLQKQNKEILLIKQKSHLVCKNCAITYGKFKNILTLLEKDLLEEIVKLK